MKSSGNGYDVTDVGLVALCEPIVIYRATSSMILLTKTVNIQPQLNH